MSSSDPFVVLLRKSIESRKSDPPYILLKNQSPIGNLNDASAVKVSDKSFDFGDPSGYKDYNVLSLLFFYINHALEHPAYMQKTMVSASEMGRELGSVTYLDRRDLLDYLTGKTSNSQYITYSTPRDKLSRPESSVSLTEEGVLASSSSAASLDHAGQKRSADDLVFGFDIKKLKPLTIEMEQDLQAVKSILGKTRTINTSATVLCCNASKNFLSIQKLGHDFFVLDKPITSASNGAKSNTTTSAKGKAPASSTKATPKPQKLGIQDYPIIFVPAASQSLINLFNAKDLLVDQKFVPSDTYRNKGENKPLQVVLERDPSKVGPTALKKFLVLDSIDSIRPQDWDRVVAVFTTGQEWQFRGWKWPKPVDIFQNVLGFALKFQDEPAQGSIPNWNVNVLNIHRNRRYLDGAVVYNFWQEVDRFIALKKPSLNR